jgi:tetratricopeptide (TPR) repeat protein
MSGNPQAALKLAERAIATNPRDPWAYYDKAMALALVCQLDRALEAFGAAEQRYSATDRIVEAVRSLSVNGSPRPRNGTGDASLGSIHISAAGEVTGMGEREVSVKKTGARPKEIDFCPHRHAVARSRAVMSHDGQQLIRIERLV